MPPATAAPPERGEPLSKKQLEIVRLAQRRSKVSEADCNSYLLETYGVAELTELQQRHLPRVLEWLALRQARRQVTEGQGLPQGSD
jgi:hypothetical protein